MPVHRPARHRPAPGAACDIGAFEEGSAVSSSPIFLPLIAKGTAPPGPDLVVEQIIATGGGVQVVIKNQSDQAVAVNIANEFWVDLYINPAPPPTGVNQTCYAGITCADFATWGVTTALLPQLTLGGSLTLTVGDSNQFFGSTSMTLTSGTTVYAQVDSDNPATTYGAVLESNEGNNIASVVSVAGAGVVPLPEDRWSGGESAGTVKIVISKW